MINIDYKTYKINKNNYYNIEYNKKQIIISLSLRKNNYNIVRLQHKNHGNHKNWNTYTINRNGLIFEHYNPKYYTDFLKNKEADKQSISIVLENMGALYKTKNNEYLNSLNEKCEKENVEEKKFLGHKYWEIFSNNQMKNLILLCKKLCLEFNIPLKLINFQYTNEKILDFNGIVFKSNYFEDSNNINPFFNIENFNKILNICN